MEQILEFFVNLEIPCFGGFGTGENASCKHQNIKHKPGEKKNKKKTKTYCQNVRFSNYTPCELYTFQIAEGVDKFNRNELNRKYSGIQGIRSGDAKLK